METTLKFCLDFSTRVKYLTQFVEVPEEKLKWMILIFVLGMDPFIK